MFQRLKFCHFALKRNDKKKSFQFYLYYPYSYTKLQFKTLIENVLDLNHQMMIFISHLIYLMMPVPPTKLQRCVMINFSLKVVNCIRFVGNVRTHMSIKYVLDVNKTDHIKIVWCKTKPRLCHL